MLQKYDLKAPGAISSLHITEAETEGSPGGVLYNKLITWATVASTGTTWILMLLNLYLTINICFNNYYTHTRTHTHRHAPMFACVCITILCTYGTHIHTYAFSFHFFPYVASQVFSFCPPDSNYHKAATKHLWAGLHCFAHILRIASQCWWWGESF